ncbi:MAG: hypothetical protein U9R02_11260, partial [Thermodesulfobacteriota bacterium]|nr:hypothetical protein [Thermodesulfobacteriota bacterium]
MHSYAGECRACSENSFYILYFPLRYRKSPDGYKKAFMICRQRRIFTSKHGDMNTTTDTSPQFGKQNAKEKIFKILNLSVP